MERYQGIRKVVVDYRLSLIGVLFLVMLLSACSHHQKPTMFTQLKPDETGIYFNNKITTADNDSSLVKEFTYMGGGVGIGDFNNDGLKDIVFTGNQVSCRLYLNKGNYNFEDVTKKAGLTTDVWATGVSVVDINNDGLDDIYICVYGGKNLLFINQGIDKKGIPHFKEEAKAYGLADDHYSTQAVFFDYDRDGKLDMFLTNYLLNGPNPNDMHMINNTGNSPANDRLYHNVGDPDNLGHPFFKDVTMKAGIKGDGYGLGVSVCDLNHDGWPDIYVTNDFLSNDDLWLNNKNGTFTNVIGESMKHQGYSSMGQDVADINNDLLPDIITLDMAPQTNERQKMQYTFMNYERYEQERSYHYQPEFTRNMLQLNNGVRLVKNRHIPFFSEIGQYAGISETDWSWCVLAADFNNDDWKDLFITNGTGRDYLNADFISYGYSRMVVKMKETKRRKELNRKLNALGPVDLPNYLYLNNKHCSFTDISDTSGLNQPGLSNGAAYVDLDNDGDLDLVVNNINKPASIFVNNTISKKGHLANHHYLEISLTGPPSNLNAFGTRILVYSDGISQTEEESPVHGYLSTMDRKLHFGLGSASMVDSLKVIWPDRSMQVLHNVPADTALTIRYQATGKLYKPPKVSPHTLFTDVTDTYDVHYKHMDYSYDDYKAEPLLPQKYSQLGPFIATGDVNNDGLTDFFIGGGFNSSGALFLQNKQGHFHYVKFDTTIKYQEDMNCIFLDVDKDGDQDLLITSGGMRYSENSPYYEPRLYINDGKGHFHLSESFQRAIPQHVRTIAGAVAVYDYDHDGYPDIFIGGRVSKQYPRSPRSFLLHNDHGKFTDVTAQVCPALERPGMVTSAVWTDIDGDGQKELVIAGEWMSIRVFKYVNGKFKEITKRTGLEKSKGLWRSLAACDVDHDGDMDLVAGNLGLNNKYHVTDKYPLKLYAADLDHNGLIDPIMFYYIKDKSGKRRLYPAIDRDKLLEQVPAFKKVFKNNKDYSTASVHDIMKYANGDFLKLTCNETRSCYFENVGHGKFVKHVLPYQAQFAPVNTILCKDFDGDGIADLLLAGNDYQTRVRTGRYDASYGLFLKGMGNHKFKAVPIIKSGFLVDGDVKDMAEIKDADGKNLVLVAVNNDSLRVFRVRPKHK